MKQWLSRNGTDYMVKWLSVKVEDAERFVTRRMVILHVQLLNR